MHDGRFCFQYIKENFLVKRCAEIGWAALGGQNLPIVESLSQSQMISVLGCCISGVHTDRGQRR